MKKMELDSLYFGVKVRDSNHGDELKTYNLFDIGGVKYSVARYVTMGEKERKMIIGEGKNEFVGNKDLFFCFCDVWSRYEYEYDITRPGGSDGYKTDVYNMYVIPNADLLMKMVKSVSQKSAKEYLREWKKMYGRHYGV